MSAQSNAIAERGASAAELTLLMLILVIGIKFSVDQYSFQVARSNCRSLITINHYLEGGGTDEAEEEGSEEGSTRTRREPREWRVSEVQVRQCARAIQRGRYELEGGPSSGGGRR